METPTTANKKILFLDHDGVICVNVPPHQYACAWDNPWKVHPFCKKCVRELNRIIEITNCEIVVSSDWRHYFTLEQLGDIYEANGIVKKPIAVTAHITLKDVDPDRKFELERKEEIHQWVVNNNITKYCVVDDMELFEKNHKDNHFAHTNYLKGIKHMGIGGKIIEILNG